MEAQGDEVDVPMPLNSAYPRGGAHVHVSNMFHQYHYHDHHHHHHDDDDPSSIRPPVMPITPNHHDHHHVLMSNSNNKHDHHQQQVNYKECLRNHAASMGGNIRDGCGEFMASKDETLICSVCNCHRNFHRKEVGGGHDLPWRGKKVITLGHHKNILSPAGRVPIIPYNMGSLLVYSSDQSDGQDEVGGGTVNASPGVAYMGFPHPPPPPPSSHHKKRFRTRFTPEQKEKMLSFAEKIGWTIQKQEESEIQQFCQEIGVKRKVLKVWLHNNKHNLNKSNSLTINGGEEEKH